MPLRKSKDNTHNWKILSHAISLSLRKITQLEIFNNSPLKREVITTNNMFSCSPELDFDGVKASRELWEKKKHEAGLGARPKSTVMTEDDTADTMLDLSNKELVATEPSRERDNSRARYQAAESLMRLSELRNNDNQDLATPSMPQTEGMNSNEKNPELPKRVEGKPKKKY